MTTNNERALEVIDAELAKDPEVYEALFGDEPGAIVYALESAGLLKPDLQGPDNDPSPHYLDGVIVARFGDIEACVSIEEYDNQEVTPDGEEVYIEVTHRAGNRLVYKTYGEYSGDPSLADARKEAMSMLAALDWIEKNK